MLYNLICQCCQEKFASLAAYSEYVEGKPLCEHCFDKHVDLLYSAHDRKKLPKHTKCGMILE